MWVVRRTQAELARLPPDPGPAAHPDQSIVIPAMAEYVRFTGKQIGMPTIRSGGGREYLRDGPRLLEALQLAGHPDDVFCIWLSEAKSNPPGGGERFGPKWEERTGSNARLLTFQSPLDDAQRDLLRIGWRVPPRQVTDVSWGWTDEEATSLPDWLTWLRALAGSLAQLPPVAAVNGRRAVFPPVIR